MAKQQTDNAEQQQASTKRPKKVVKTTHVYTDQMDLISWLNHYNDTNK